MRQLLFLLTILWLTSSSYAEQNVYSFKVKDIDEKEFNLASLKGNVTLVVNVASKCGLTPQYKDLQKIYDRYKEKGFVVLGFPANNFGKQEPGNNFEIKQFCTSKYNVTFPMMAKVDVRENKEPLYKYLTEHGQFGGDIKWNFEKFLVGRDGKVIKRFSPKTKPQDRSITKAIEVALKKKK